MSVLAEWHHGCTVNCVILTVRCEISLEWMIILSVLLHKFCATYRTFNIHLGYGAKYQRLVVEYSIIRPRSSCKCVQSWVSYCCCLQFSIAPHSPSFLWLSNHVVWICPSLPQECPRPLQASSDCLSPLLGKAISSIHLFTVSVWCRMIYWNPR